jgi:V/A-type H+/Na+-transporting ATPase subunit E
MAEQLQELLERINREGVEKAEKKAGEIIAAAEKKAKEIVEAAEKQAAERKAAAAADAENLKKNAEKAIQQSSRNVLIYLQEEIQKYFDRILTAAIAESLPAEALTAAILGVIEKGAAAIGGSEEIEVAINPADAKKISGDLVARFKKTTGEKLTVKPVPAVDAGFTVSFDGGRSSYDFTDNGLRDLVSTYLSPHLKEIISS